MAVKPEEIACIIRQQIEQFGSDVTAVDVGTSSRPATASRASTVCATPVLASCWSSTPRTTRATRRSVMGMALNLEEDTVGAIVLGDYTDIKKATRSARPAASSRCPSATP